jgi:hypothetical protein
MRAESPRTFVGNTTDYEAIKCLPVGSSCPDLRDLRLEEMQAIRSEAVDVPAMKRQRTVRMGPERREQLHSDIIGRLARKDKNAFAQVLPIGLFMCVPIRLPGAEKSRGREALRAEDRDHKLRFLFGFEKDSVLQVLDLQYGADGRQAERVALHAFRRTRDRP